MRLALNKYITANTNKECILISFIGHNTIFLMHNDTLCHCMF